MLYPKVESIGCKWKVFDVLDVVKKTGCKWKVERIGCIVKNWVYCKELGVLKVESNGIETTHKSSVRTGLAIEFKFNLPFKCPPFCAINVLFLWNVTKNSNSTQLLHIILLNGERRCFAVWSLSTQNALSIK